jgi:hypothetical protein
VTAATLLLLLLLLVVLMAACTPACIKHMCLLLALLQPA